MSEEKPAGWEQYIATGYGINGPADKAKDGVSVPAFTSESGGRDSSGRWVKGVSGNPAGKPKKGPEFFQHFLNKLPPDQMAAKLLWAIEKAQEQNSPKAVLAIAELYYAYLDGRPVQRTQQVEGGLADVLEQLG